jgi:hypothetical protein
MKVSTTTSRIALCSVLAVAGCTTLLLAADPPTSAKTGDVVMDALVDELGRSMKLQLEDLQSPYFVQYAVEESTSYRISATCGALVSSDDSRSRRLSADVRVGYYDLDNTNFAGGGGGGGMGGRRGGGGSGFGGGSGASLPQEDNYAAIRQAAWIATDGAYKSAVETLTQKKAYMEDHQIADRPDDFARAEAVVQIDPKSELNLDVAAWETRLRALSQAFLKYPHIQDSQVSLAATANNRYLINSEGTRLRTGDAGVVLTVVAQAQAEDGEIMSDRFSEYAASADALPSEAQLLKRVDELASRLSSQTKAAVLEDYMGPVLFDGDAAPQLFQALMSRGVAAQSEPVGGGRRRSADSDSLDKYLNKRVLPRTFRVYDNPLANGPGGAYLAGRYTIDDEGVHAQPVDIVVGGSVKGLLTSRTPTSDFRTSNGHARGRGLAGIGCLFIEAEDGVPNDELKKALIDAAEEQQLEYGLRIVALESAGGGLARAAAAFRAGPGGGARGGGPGGFGGAPSALGDPVVVYKVYLDGREELVRGCEFGSIDVGALKDILAAGNQPSVYNAGAPAGGGSSIIAPAVLFEEVELFAIQEEKPTLPIVAAPHQRQ